jgi:hypothetical protein
MSLPPNTSDVLAFILDKPSTLTEIAEHFECAYRQAEAAMRTLARKRLVLIVERIPGPTPGRKVNRWTATVGADVISALTHGEMQLRMRIREERREKSRSSVFNSLHAVSLAWARVDQEACAA